MDRPDLVVLDTGPSAGSSLVDLLSDAGLTGSNVLLVASDERFAVEAIQLRMCGYVTRPIDRTAFLQALEWAKIQIHRKNIEEQSERFFFLAEGGEHRRGVADRLMVKSRGHIHVVKLEDIDWIEANAGYFWIHTGGKKHLLRGKMKSLEENLPEDRFVRIHRSLIVNIDRIQELQHHTRGEYNVILNDGTKLSMSRGYRNRLFSVFVKAS
jgi:two-component system LytT family response regulator